MPQTVTEERTGLITMKGDPLTLLGKGVELGDTAPDFTVVGQDMKEKKLSDYRGKVVLLSVVPSLDTSVCDQETRTFNQKASQIGENVAVLTVSMDTPPAIKRWCGAAGIERVECFSDFKHWSVGENYGLRIKELGLLARAVYVIDANGKIVHAELVSEVANEPDYDAAIEAAKKAAS